MLSNSYRLPVTIENLQYGLKEAVGLLHFNKKEIVLELQQQDSFIGVVKSDVSRFTIPFSEIADIKLDKGFFSGSLVIETNHLDSLSEIPGNKQGSLELKIERKDRKEAARAVSALNFALSEYRLNQLDEGSE